MQLLIHCTATGSNCARARTLAWRVRLHLRRDAGGPAHTKEHSDAKYWWWKPIAESRCIWSKQ